MADFKDYSNEALLSGFIEISIHALSKVQEAIAAGADHATVYQLCEDIKKRQIEMQNNIIKKLNLGGDV